MQALDQKSEISVKRVMSVYYLLNNVNKMIIYDKLIFDFVIWKVLYFVFVYKINRVRTNIRDLQYTVTHQLIDNFIVKIILLITHTKNKWNYRILKKKKKKRRIYRKNNEAIISNFRWFLFLSLRFTLMNWTTMV